MLGCSGEQLVQGPVAMVLQPPCAGLHLPVPSYPVPSLLPALHQLGFTGGLVWV